MYDVALKIDLCIHSPMRLHGVVLVKHRDNFTFYDMTESPDGEVSGVSGRDRTLSYWFRFFVFFSLPPCKSWNSFPSYIRADSLPVLSNSLFNVISQFDAM
jgi:hypothetical protein